VQVAGAYGAAQRTIAGAKARRGGYVPPKPVVERLLGIDWMTLHGLYQSIPPAYTAYVGHALIDHLRAAA
jgi:DNA (cytosine-5)-methyltransferase 1